MIGTQVPTGPFAENHKKHENTPECAFYLYQGLGRCKRDALPTELSALRQFALFSTLFAQPEPAKVSTDWYTRPTNPFGWSWRNLVTVVPIEVAHFWAKVKINGTAMCWIWTGNTTVGYGRFRGERAHRYAYRLHRGEIPDGLMIRHLCGNKLCVNPSHLEPGTMADNSQDGIRLGEILRGSRNGRAKLTDEAVAYILANPDDLRGSQLAAKFNVSPATISLIRSGRRWSHAA